MDSSLHTVHLVGFRLQDYFFIFNFNFFIFYFLDHVAFGLGWLLGCVDIGLVGFWANLILGWVGRIGVGLGWLYWVGFTLLEL